VKHIIISEPLEYVSADKFKLIGSGQVIDASGLAGSDDILTVIQGENAEISNLTLIGSHTSINPDPRQPRGGRGIYFDVRSSQAGVVLVKLNHVTVMNVGSHGIHISDCSLTKGCGDGNDGGGSGSTASLHVELNKVHINHVGFGKADADGMRIDERGEGDVFLTIRNSAFVNVGADGVEIDEGNNGDVVVDIRQSLFEGNGEFCRKVVFVAGSPCDDKGEPDADDGFDIDEAGGGALIARVHDTLISNNADEGLDFDEKGDGEMDVSLISVFTMGNQDEGVKFSEKNDGGLMATVQNLTSYLNNGAKEGVEFEEQGVGNVVVEINDSSLIGADKERLKIEQQGQGQGTLKLRRSNIRVDLDGVDKI
jgi:hypothetical protein